MRNLLLSIVFVLSFTGIVKAENSAQGYDLTSIAQQVFTAGYVYQKTGATTVAKNDVVVVDTTNGTINQSLPNKNSLGAYVIDTTTTDSVYVLGVADEDIASGSAGRICIRGPHKVNFLSAGNSGAYFVGKAAGTSTTSGKAAVVATATGTARGTLGTVLSATASTDTGDSNVFWVWVNPSVLN